MNFVRFALIASRIFHDSFMLPKNSWMAEISSLSGSTSIIWIQMCSFVGLTFCNYFITFVNHEWGQLANKYLVEWFFLCTRHTHVSSFTAYMIRIDFIQFAQSIFCWNIQPIFINDVRTWFESTEIGTAINWTYKKLPAIFSERKKVVRVFPNSQLEYQFIKQCMFELFHIIFCFSTRDTVKQTSKWVHFSYVRQRTVRGSCENR